LSFKGSLNLGKRLKGKKRKKLEEVSSHRTWEQARLKTEYLGRMASRGWERTRSREKKKKIKKGAASIKTKQE